ncbi:hypothetical protein ACFWGD_02940 [Corynebacterium sp. NPDC060344]|uniref:hypothetical protein n=1 Tax=Corynebacterium sp. NPDC060344 TaxID=3347101 RepID=UPI003668E400
MNTPNDRNRELAAALADLEAAAERVASLARGFRGDVEGGEPRDAWQAPPPRPPMPMQQPMQQPTPGQQPSPVQPAGPPSAPQYGPQVGPQFDPQHSAQQGAQHGPQHGPQVGPQHGAPHGAQHPPKAPADPWWSNEKTVLKVTAAIGAIITISGVGLLVALAIQSGLLGPLGRVILAYALAAALAGTAVVVHRKNPDNAGVTAAGAASVVTAHITTTVLVHGLEWWPSWLGTVVALAVMGLGYLAARFWQSAALHIVILLASFIAVCSIAIPDSGDAGAAGTVTIAVFVPSVAAAWAWFGMAKRPVIATFAVILFLFGSIPVLVDAAPGWLAIAAFIVFGFALALPDFLDDASAAALPGTGPGNQPGHQPGNAPGTGPAAIAALQPSADFFPLRLLAWLAAPMVAIFGQLHLTSAAIALVLGLAIGAAGFGPWLDRADPRMATLRWAGLCSAALPALQLATTEPNLSWTRMPSLLVAAGVIWFHVFRPSRMGRWLIPIWTVVALIANFPALVLTMFAPSYLIEHRMFMWTVDVPNVTLSGLLIGVCALGLIAIVASRRESATGFDKSCGLVGLLLTAVPVIIVLTEAGMRFSLAHVLVSIGWMIAAAWLMLAPKRFNVDANMAASLVIATAAVVKLVFYDMQAMSGLTRVAAFLLCGLLMLGMVVARSLRDRNADEKPRTGPGAGHGPPPGKPTSNGQNGPF